MLPVLRRTNGFTDFDRFFESAFGTAAAWHPAVDVHETDEAFELLAELPGLAPEDVNVTVEDGQLEITGEKKADFKSGEGNRRVVERRYGKFVRTFTLPRTVDGEKIEAGFDNGLLTVKLPKSSVAKARRIDIR